MESINNKPWNVVPKNGTSAFFTEESYAKWFGRESHESRLALNLKKIGITLPPTEPRKFDLEGKGATLSTQQKIHLEERSENDNTTRDTNFPAGETARPRKNPVKHFLKQKQLEATCTATSSATVTQDVDQTTLPTAQDGESTSVQNTDMTEDEHMKSNTSLDTGVVSGSHEAYMVENQSGEKEVEETVLDVVPGLSEVKEESSNPPSVPKPITASAVFDISETQTQPVHQKIVSNEKANDPTVKQPSTHICIDGNAPRPAVPTSQSSDVKRPSSKAEIKKLMAENIFYFNNKDRTDKYMPKIYFKKPVNRKSVLTVKEQRSFFTLHQSYDKELPDKPTQQEQDDIEQYKTLAPIVHNEQKHFQNYLRYAASKCENDYRYIHPDADKYITAKLQGKKRRVWAYPRYYKHVSNFDLPDAVPENLATLQYVRPLLEMGHVSRLVLPSIIPGCPQPCTPTSYKEVSSVCPPIRDKVEGPLVWDHEECSRDVNLEQLAVPNKCDVALSANSLKYLVDHQGYHCKFWDMPVTVREYDMIEGGEHIIHRVIFLDKPLIRMSEYSIREKHVMYQKYAMKTAALRPKQKMVVFSRIKPAFTVTKAPEQQAIVKEIVNWESNVKATVIQRDNSTDDSGKEETDDENNSSKPGKNLRKSEGKKNKQRERKQEMAEPIVKNVGLFDFEKDIDDLETFGMDSPPKLKLSKCMTDDPGIKGKIAKKQPFESDLDLLKKELQGIKNLAKKDVEKLPNGPKVTADGKPSQDLSSTETSASVLRQEKEEINRGKDTGIDNVQVEGDCLLEGNTLQKDKTEARNVASKKEATQDEVEASSSDGKPVKRNLRKLSVENVSSLSAIMKRMSTVKAKLMERNQSKQNSNEDIMKSDGTSTFPTQYQPLCAHTVRKKSAEAEPPELESKTADTESDSDTETGGLVIDMPEGTESQATKAKTDGASARKPDSYTVEMAMNHETIESPPASPGEDLDTPESPVCAPPLSPDEPSDMHDADLQRSCVVIPLEETNNEAVVRDYSAVKYEHIAYTSESILSTTELHNESGSSVKEELQEKATDDEGVKEDQGILKQEHDFPAPVTRGAKRRSSEIVKAEATISKRFLRSSMTEEEAAALTGDSKKAADRQAVQVDTNAIEKSQVTTRGRGRKTEVTTERITRSRSVSMESHNSQCTSPALASRRVTRHSLDSTKHSLDSVEVEPEVPMKRRRGRPPKKSTEDTQCISVDGDKPQTTATGDQDQVNPDHEDVGTGEKRDTVSNAEDLSKSDVSSSREEMVNEDKPKRRGRPPKRSSQDLIEAQKVHELAEAMKKKIAASEEEKAKKLATSEDEKAKKLTASEEEKAKKIAASEVAKNIANSKDDKVIAQPKVPGNSENQKTSQTVESQRATTGVKHSKESLQAPRGPQIQPIQNINQGMRKETPGDVKPEGHASGLTGQNKEAPGGLDSILNMQTKMLKPTDVKGSSSHEQFASQHGVKRVVYPVDGNLTYNQWSLGEMKVLVRSSYHGHSTPQGIVHLAQKMEYQPSFGFEKETANETCRNWMSVYVRPNTTLVRARINPYNSEVMMLEHTNFYDLIPPDSNFKPLKAFTDLHTILQKLKSLSAGQYLLRKNSLAGKLTIVEATDEPYRTIDLHKYHASFTKGNEPRAVQWLPIDTKLLLPHHKSRQMVPCLYQPYDGTDDRKKKGKKKKRKHKPPVD